MNGLESEKIDVTVAVEFHDEGTVSFTFGPVAPDDVGDLLASVGTPEFAYAMLTKLADMIQRREEP